MFIRANERASYDDDDDHLITIRREINYRAVYSFNIGTTVFVLREIVSVISRDGGKSTRSA